ncbi:MAG: MATE family efflux transporter [Butyrivibrio sp.]|uniref:MATE family efflux transporter n=1 Tax=Butyrivibrio sp. TaxID=28121 RepID=UPI0025BD3012|nr:MATE family efflux transporter [Butyrivibrio sp.]MBQ6588264.1 MATE family efflux transporter [Butyrivibrio sp.]
MGKNLKFSKDKDLTTGSPFSLIFSFAVSMMMGNVFQQLYTVVDSIIIGKKIGPLGLAAIGGTDWLIFLVNGFLIGLIQGFSVILGKKFGEKNEKDFATYYKKARLICLVISIVFVAGLLVSSGLLLRLIGTKTEAFSYAKTYVDVIFAGIPFLVFYQFFAAVLRSRGNSQIHLMAMTISSICNIILDLFFICVLNMGIAGAALGTVLSECLVMVICGYYVYTTRKGAVTTEGKSTDDISVHTAGSSAVVQELLTVGLPMALQSVITAIGGLIVIRCVNQFEIDFLTGYTIAGKIYALLEIAASSYGMAVVAYVSQNYGAGRHYRIRSGVRISVLMGVVTALVCSFIMIFFGTEGMKLFVDEATVSDKIFVYGQEYLLILGIFYPLLYVLYIMRASLQGLGNTLVPMISSFGQLIMRVFCAVVLTLFIGYKGIFYGEITAWILADLILIFTYFLSVKKQ